MEIFLRNYYALNGVRKVNNQINVLRSITLPSKVDSC